MRSEIVRRNTKRFRCTNASNVMCIIPIYMYIYIYTYIYAYIFDQVLTGSLDMTCSEAGIKCLTSGSRAGEAAAGDTKSENEAGLVHILAVCLQVSSGQRHFIHAYMYAHMYIHSCIHA